MTELSDYRRIVEKPMLDSMLATERKLRAALREARVEINRQMERTRSDETAAPYEKLLAQIDAALGEQ